MATRFVALTDAEVIDFKSALMCLAMCAQEKMWGADERSNRYKTLIVQILLHIALQCHEHDTVAVDRLESKQ